MKPLEFSVLGPLMGGFGSQAFLGCVHVEEGGIKPIVMVFLPEEIVEDDELLRRVFAETELASRIDHVNVIGVVGIAKLEEGYARVVEYADAESLRSVYRRAQTLKKQIPATIATAIVADACMGAHYAHELGEMESGAPLIHGGIRPETLLLSFQGMAKVTGYGVTTLVDALNRARGTDGSVRDAYTAPEQSYGGRAAATVQTDVYALGTVLYEALTGKQPYGHDTDLAEAMIRDELKRPGAVTDEMAQIVIKATQRRSKERYANPLEMRHDLLEHCETATELEVRAFMDELFPRDMVPRSTRDQLLGTARKSPPRPTGRILVELPTEPERVVTDPRVRAARMLNHQPTLSVAADAPPSWNAADTMPPQPSPARQAQAASAPVQSAPPPPTAQAAPSMPQVAPSMPQAPPPPAVLSPAAPIPSAAPPRPSPPPSYPPPHAYASPPSWEANPTMPPHPGMTMPPTVVQQKAPTWLYVGFGLAAGVAVALGAVMFTRGDEPTPAPDKPPEVAQPAPPSMPLEPIQPAAPAADDGADGADGAGKAAAARAGSDRGGSARDADRRGSSADERAKDDGPKKAAGPGKIVVSTDPPMEITVDGKPVGNGSGEIEVPPGKHTVKAFDKSKGLSKSRVVKVAAGKTANVDLSIGKGALYIEAPDGSKVFVDGKPVGTTPMGPVEVYEGTRKVLVKQGTLEYRHNVPVKPGIEATLTVQFHHN